MGVIYKITNIINNKIYIGKRIFTKEKFLRVNYFGGGKLIKLSISKYGIENFSREIIEEVDNEILSEREIYWIKFYNSRDLKIGYNLKEGGESKSGRKCGSLSEETKQKLRIKALKQFENGGIFKGKKHTEETKKKISEKKRGSVWNDDTRKKFIKTRTGMKHKKNKIIKIKIDVKIPILQKTLDGVIIQTYDSIGEASKITGFDRSCISRNCKGENKTCKGYKFEYLYEEKAINYNSNKGKKIIQKDINGYVIKIWNNLPEIKRELNFSTDNIYAVCRGYQKTSNGFFWEYLE